MMRKRNIFAPLLIIYLGAVVYLCFGHFNDLPQIGQDSLWGIQMDKVVHFLMFFPFPILCHAAFRPQGKKGWRTVVTVFIIFVTGCALAAGTELGQSLTDYRSGDPMDFLADLAALTGASIVTVLAELLTLNGKTKLCSNDL